jgi:hypothetical protein
MRIFHCLSEGFLALGAVAVCAQPAPSFDVDRIDRDIRILSSDEFEGRAPATRGEQMTVQYLIRELNAAGVQPGGEIVNGVRQWTQRVPLYTSDFAAPPKISLTHGGKAQALTQTEEIALMPPVNGQNQVTLNNVPLVSSATE